MYTVFKNGKEIGSGTLTECIEHIATKSGLFHPEQVTAQKGVADGFSISKA